MLLMLSLPLYAMPTPFEGADAEITTEDRNGDGHAETLTSWNSIGSGWQSFWTCVTDGATGHVACRTLETTSYAPYSGEKIDLQPAAGNTALALLPWHSSRDLPAGDPGRPAQGAMWAMKHSGVVEGRLAPELTWFAGRPVPQEAVYLTQAQAAGLAGALGWEPSGGERDITGFVILYNVPRLSSLGVLQSETAALPQVVAESDRYVVYQDGQMLAVYDVAKNRHTWAANLADGTDEAFKTNRWARIGGVSLTGSTLSVAVNHQMSPDTVVHIELQ